MSHPATDTAELRKLSRREVMAARSITRRIAAAEASAALDPTDPARFHSVALPAGERAPQLLTFNPNTGKRHAARQGIGGFDSITGQRILTRDERAERDARRDYRPLTVSHPTMTPGGRVSTRKPSSYTV